jgi:hypothetical protein
MAPIAGPQGLSMMTGRPALADGADLHRVGRGVAAPMTASNTPAIGQGRHHGVNHDGGGQCNKDLLGHDDFLSVAWRKVAASMAGMA